MFRIGKIDNKKPSGKAGGFEMVIKKT